MLGIGAARLPRARPRCSWGLFSASVLCGALSMALYPVGRAVGRFGPVRDAARPRGVRSSGRPGIAVFIRGFGGADPDAWLDAAAVGVALVAADVRVRPRYARRPAAVTGRDVGFVRPGGGRRRGDLHAAGALRDPAGHEPAGLSLLGAVIGVVLVIDAGYYVGVGLRTGPCTRPCGCSAYGAWAAGGLHPDATRLRGRRACRPPRRSTRRSAAPFTSVVIHSAVLHRGPRRLLASTWRGAGASTFPCSSVAFVLQIVLVCGTRRCALIVRLREDDRRRREAEHALRTSEERFRRLAEVAPVGIFVTDATARSTFQNEAWAQTAGVGRRRALGTGLLRTIHPDDRECAMAAWLEAAETGSRPDRSSTGCSGRTGPSAGSRPRAAPLCDAAGRRCDGLGRHRRGRHRADRGPDRRPGARGVRQRRSSSRRPVGIGIFGTDGRPISANHAQRRIRELAAPGEAAAADVREDALMATPRPGRGDRAGVRRRGGR